MVRVFFVAVLLVAAQGRPIRLHVCSGKKMGGRSQTNILSSSRVLPPRELKQIGRGRPLELNTDTKGVAIIPSDIMPWISVVVDWHRACVPTRDEEAIFNVGRIIDAGFVARNSCGHAIAALTPGDLYVFVRNETLFEKMRH
jgi:hypothetical protein